MKQRKWFVALMILMASVVNTDAAGRKALAVMDFEGLGVSDVERHVISERFRAELSRTAQFQVMDRRQMAFVLQSEENTNGFAVDFVDLGKKMSVERFSVGNISKLGSTYSVVANLVDATNGQTIKTVIEDYKGGIDGLLKTGVRQVAEKLAEHEAVGCLVFVGPRRNDSIRRLTVKINGEQLREFPDGDFMVVSNVPAGTHTLEFEWSRPGINGRRPPYKVNLRAGQVVTIETNAIRYKPTLRVSQPVKPMSRDEWQKIYWPEVYPDKRYVRGEPSSMMEIDFEDAK